MISNSFKQLSIAIGIAILIFPIMFCVGLWVVSEDSKECKPPETKVDTLKYRQHFHSKSPQDGLMEALIYYDVKYPHIVYAQAVLETGHFKSDLCLNGNNLFGLYDSKKHRYYTFDHWKDCIIAYKEMIQYKYKDGDDYLNFLKEIGYAEDPEYICKLKKLIKNPP